jgi:hypothetical protein
MGRYIYNKIILSHKDTWGLKTPLRTGTGYSSRWDMNSLLISLFLYIGIYNKVIDEKNCKIN